MMGEQLAKKVEWFWWEIAKRIEKEYKDGKPSTWRKKQIKLFIAELNDKVLFYCKQNARATKNCGIKKDGREVSVPLSYDTFRRIFVTKESLGNKTTKNVFAAYCGYPSFEDFVRDQYPGEFTPAKQSRYSKNDIKVAWETHVELRTRVATRQLPAGKGNEEGALNSFYSLFKNTRESMKINGPISPTVEHSLIELLETIEPFTTEWHQKKLNGAFNDKRECGLFRQQLKELQKELKVHLAKLGAILGR